MRNILQLFYNLLACTTIYFLVSCQRNVHEKLAVLTTNRPSDITSNSAISGGNITQDGGSNIVGNGVCWSNNNNPTIWNNVVASNLISKTFTCTIKGLQSNNIYYVRAYAKNSNGYTSYGNQESFTTSDTVN